MTNAFKQRDATFGRRSEILGKYCKVSFAFDKANAEVTVTHSDTPTIFGVSDQDRHKPDCTDTKVTRGFRFRLKLVVIVLLRHRKPKAIIIMCCSVASLYAIAKVSLQSSSYYTSDENIRGLSQKFVDYCCNSFIFRKI